MLRRFRTPALVVAGLLSLYAIAGFLVLPAVARSYAADHLRETYGLDLAVGKLRFNPFTLLARVDELTLDARDGERLVSFERLAANVGWRSLFERALVFQSIELAGPFVHLHLREDGTLNLAAAFSTPQAGERPDAGEGAPPALIVDEFVLAQGALRFTDERDGRDFDRRFEPLGLHLHGFSTRPQERSELVALMISLGDGGQLMVSGTLSAEPVAFDLDLVAADVPLAIAQPYVPETLAAEIAGGALSFTLDVHHGLPGQPTALAVRGAAAVTGLAIEVSGRGEPVLSWNEVVLNRIELDLSPDRLVIGELAIDGLDSLFRIHRNGDTNVGLVMRAAARDGESAGPGDGAGDEDPAPPSGGEAAAAGAGEDFPFSIGRIAITGSKLLFNDQQIVPPVTIGIADLAGEITGLASTPGSRLSAKIKGGVGDHGGADISGGAALFTAEHDLDADVSFTNVEMTDVSPYAGKFAGYQISKGKLFLDLHYTLEGSRIKGENRALFDQLELGARVDSEDATSLPVKFALSLLRDRHGRIDIRLPVEGDVDAPGFRFGHLIGQALLNLLTRMVTAPFTFIADLFGGGPDMEYAVFEAGSGTISAEERQKILPLATALEERPRLLVEVQGWADPEADGAVLRGRKLDALLAAAGATAATPAAALEAAYEAQFGAGAAEALRAEMAATPPSGNGSSAAGPPDPEGPAAGSRPEATAPGIGPAAYEAELRARLLAAQPVTQEELLEIAFARGRQVMTVLVVDGGVDAERIFVRRGELTAKEGTRAKLILDAR